MDSQDNAGVSRRQIAAGGAALIVPRHVLGGPGYQAPSDTLAIAGIGIGGMGRRYLQACESERVVALCDVDYDFAAKVFKRYPAAKRYRDWRELFDKEQGIDAVIVATPDHSHALITLAALRARKHVYCAKPLTRTLSEARRVAAAAAEAGTATQTSVQSCASDEACSAAEVLMAGTIGPVREVHVWSDHPLYPAGQTRPAGTTSVPEGLNWNLWIGPAPYRPFSRAYHPWIWRAWWDFGTGTVGDMLSHSLHVFYRALELQSPVAVHANRSTMHTGLFEMEPNGNEHLPPRLATPETESYSSVVAWDFPARGSHPPLRLHWYDGGMKPFRPAELDRSRPMPNSGVLFIGDKGKLLTGYSGERRLLLPEGRFRDFVPPPKTLPRTIGHYSEWLLGAKTGKATSCDFQFGSRLAEVALLGTLAARSARYLEWHAASSRITNDAEAQAWVDPPYRQGWSS